MGAPPTVVQDQQIDSALVRGLTILTGNQRAARTLRHRFDLRQHARGLAQWEPPAILSWESWTADLWQQLLLGGYTDKLLLNRLQEHTLWRSIIAEDSETASLRSTDSLAELAADAYARLCAWRGETRLRSLGTTTDTRAFQRWALDFERRCRAVNLNYLPLARLESTLAAETDNLILPSGLLLLGFDSFAPAQQHLLDALRAVAVSIETKAHATPTPPATLIAAPDEPSELHTAARWALQHLQQHPQAQIALIVPDLDAQRPALERVLRHTLSPELEDIAATVPPPFEFSLGVPLAGTPLAATALDILLWTTQPLPLERVSQLLLSPFFSGYSGHGLDPELTIRATFDAQRLRTRSSLRPEVSLDTLLHLVRREDHIPRLHRTISALRQAVTAEGIATGETRPAADWADAIHNLLEAAGWSAHTDDSLTFQTRRRFDTLLDEIATLDFGGARLAFPDVLDTLQRLARQTLFAPESRNAPVQVLGPLEAAGSTFDALLFLRAGDLTWPAPPALSPLLPYELQRSLGMPGSAPAADAAYFHSIAGRLLASASTTVVSYAQHTADSAQRLSPALSGLTTAATNDLLPAEAASEPVPLEVIPDDITLPSPPDEILRGGHAILKSQAACPFRAFAEYRLFSTPLRTAEAGLDAAERGSLVHLILQRFWNEVRDQQTLRSLTEQERLETLSRAIDTALREEAPDTDTAWDKAYLEVQRERLLSLLGHWLEAELERGVPFTVVQQESTLRDVRIGPLRLELRVDRIDETEHGDVILDYKTGRAHPSAWLSDRPEEPQLPLYAVLADRDRLAGVAFAQVRAGEELSLQGIQTESGILLKPYRNPLPLERQREEWHRVLEALAEEFHRGDVRVNPNNYPNTCEYCAERILCRLDPTRLDRQEEDQHG